MEQNAVRYQLSARNNPELKKMARIWGDPCKVRTKLEYELSLGLWCGGISGYDVCLTRARSRVQSSLPIFLVHKKSTTELTYAPVNLLPINTGVGGHDRLINWLVSSDDGVPYSNLLASKMVAISRLPCMICSH